MSKICCTPKPNAQENDWWQCPICGKWWQFVKMQFQPKKKNVYFRVKIDQPVLVWHYSRGVVR